MIKPPQKDIFIPSPSQTLLNPTKPPEIGVGSVPAPKANTPKSEETPSFTDNPIKIQLDNSGVTIEVSGWSHFYESASEAACMLLELYQYKSYDLPKVATRSDNQFKKGVRADGKKDDSRVLESRGLVDSPPWGDQVPDILGALMDPTSFNGALSGEQGIEKKFATALRGGLNLTAIKPTAQASQEQQAKVQLDPQVIDPQRVAVTR